ncbi:MAG: PEP/pyruvate-binding domain-containing protein [Labilithrix sp.]
MRRLALALVFLTACSSRKKPPAPESMEASAPASSVSAAAVKAPEDAGPKAWPVWTAKIANEEEFKHYSTEVGTDRYVKLVVDLKSKATYYADADLYPMHKDFIFAELLKKERTPEAVREFDRNYGKDKPEFLMLYVVHHQKQDLWSLAFWEGDKATAAHVRQAFESLRATFYEAPKVKFRPCSNDQEAVAKELEGELAFVSNDELFKALAYQVFHQGVAIGKLRIVKGRLENAVFAPDEIVILPEPLTDITPVAGIISQTHSTPLSHVNLRAAAWDIPNAGILDATKTWGALDGKIVRYEAGLTSAEVRLATKEEIDAAQKAKHERTTVQVPKADLNVTSLATLDTLHAKDAAAYGQKTSNLGEIIGAKLPGVRVPPGFGVPISHYERHLKAAGIDAEIDKALTDPKFKTSAVERKVQLEKIRKRIQDAPLDPALVTTLTESLTKLTADADAGADPGVFVRSSTNAEDLKGFSGAGLYDTVPNVHGAAAVGDAVKKVWASVWNLAAYEERELYKVDQKQVFGAVLVQLGIAATAAGVLVTSHPTDPKDTHTIQINAKSGLGMRVVDGKRLPEIILYNTFNKGLRIVSRSDEDTMLVFSGDGGVREVPNPNKREPILTNARVQKLADAALKLKGIFPKDRPLDIEWVLRGEELFIVQSRPFMGGPKP